MIYWLNELPTRHFKMAPLLARLKQLGLPDAAFRRDERTLQRQLAPELRKRAIEHLANGQGVVAKSFRGEYFASGLGTYQQFLNVQARPDAWGTYIEATALGELIGCHVVVTPVKSGIEQHPICLYRATDDNAPLIHLYNSNNTHWYVKSSTPTEGDGNCLFNAFAQALKTQVAPELRFIAPTSPSSAVKKHGFLGSKPSLIAENEVIQFQKNIEQAVSKHASPAQLNIEFQREKQRISRLTTEEQQQISLDYQLALELSREEMGYARRNIVCNSRELEEPYEAQTFGI